MQKVRSYIRRASVPAIYFFLCLTFFISIGTAKSNDSTTLIPRDVSGTAIMGGVVRPVNSAMLSFMQPGIVVNLPEEGLLVKKGDTIASQDSRMTAVNLAEAKTALEAAKLTVETEKHSRGKTERLVKENILAEIALKEADFSLKKAEANSKIASHKLAAAELAMENSHIKAPFQGIITQVLANRGEQIAAGAPVVQIMDPASLKLTVDVSLAAGAQLKQGTKVDIIIDDKKVGTAELKRILPVLDPATGLRRTIWTVSSSDAMLAGRFVTLNLKDSK